MKRNPRKLRWTKSFRKAAGKELVVDGHLALAARRHVPVRYDREQLSVALQAMRRVATIRARRERVFYAQRMAGNRARRRADDRKLVEENAHLLPRERGSVRVAREEAERLEEDEMVLQQEEMEEKVAMGKGEAEGEGETEVAGWRRCRGDGGGLRMIERLRRQRREILTTAMLMEDLMTEAMEKYLWQARLWIPTMTTNSLMVSQKHSDTQHSRALSVFKFSSKSNEAV